MIDLEFVQSLIRSIDESGLDSIEIERDGTRIKLSKTPAIGLGPAPAAATNTVPALAPLSGIGTPPDVYAAEVETVSSSTALIEVKSPMVGTFFLAPTPEAPPYAEIGSRVKPGDTLCIIEAMKLMNELECEVSGIIEEICVENDEPVEYGQVLFRVSA